MIRRTRVKDTISRNVVDRELLYYNFTYGDIDISDDTDIDTDTNNDINIGTNTDTKVDTSRNTDINTFLVFLI